MEGSLLGVAIALLMYTAGIVRGAGDPILIGKSFGRPHAAFLNHCAPSRSCVFICAWDRALVSRCVPNIYYDAHTVLYSRSSWSLWFTAWRQAYWIHAVQYTWKDHPFVGERGPNFKVWLLSGWDDVSKKLYKYVGIPVHAACSTH